LKRRYNFERLKFHPRTGDRRKLTPDEHPPIPINEDEKVSGALNRIMYVEDEPDIQAIAKLALEAIGGFTVKICSSGREALTEAAAFAPDLILLDVMMPGMDGPTTLKAMREIAGLKQTPVIFMTAKVQPQEVAFYHQLGALDVIAKPFDPMSLSSSVRSIWENH